MKTIVFNKEELSIILYSLIVAKDHIDASQHPVIDHLIEILNK